jgi:hypothetical protein
MTVSSPATAKDWRWPLWPLLPLYPYGQRRTLRREIIPGTLWTFEQIQGVLYVVVPIRMTVVRLAAGGLLVYAPIAPTPECVRLLQELESVHGEVKYIILPTITGLEHKVFVAPFARRFRQAQIFVIPNQWSFPVNLPLSWLGLPSHRTQLLPADASKTPFADEFDYAILGPIPLGLGPFGEVAFFHRASKSVLLTDTLVSIPYAPPAVVQLDPFPLLFHAKESSFEPPSDTPANRLKGWQRSCLFAFYFRPHSILPVEFWDSLKRTGQAPDRSRRNYFGWFPFRWEENWQQAFAALAKQGKAQVAPILQTLILNRGPAATLDWVERVCQWTFEQVIPCHLEAPISVTPAEFREAFAFLRAKRASSTEPLAAIAAQDLAFLEDLDKQLCQRGITPPRPPLVG